MRNPLCLDGLRGPRLLHPMHTCSMGDSFVFPAAESAPTVYCTMSTASARKSCSSNSLSEMSRPTTNHLAQNKRKWGGRALRSSASPPGTALSDCARRKPSEISSQTQSVSAFLPGTVSMGAPFLRRIALRDMPPLRRG